MRLSVRAPSNIALIKYMGKTDSKVNLPENGSLSVTLRDRCTFAEIDTDADRDRWVAEAPTCAPESSVIPRLSDEGIGKVIRHIELARSEASAILNQFGLKSALTKGVVLRTANTFPEASGIASSASSFAAITLAVTASCAADPQAFAKVWDQEPTLRRRLAKISRRGSGSSCRSFEGPFVEWRGEEAFAVESDLPALAHFVLIVSEKAKAVSSSKAHLLVKTSPLWTGRVERVEKRLAELRGALTGDVATREQRFAKIARAAWSEAWEMHSLFHTCAEPFSYWQPGTIDLLHALAPSLAEPMPPIVTLDAGPNVHVLVDAAQADEWRARLQKLSPETRILEDRPGRGAEIL